MAPSDLRKSRPSATHSFSTAAPMSAMPGNPPVAPLSSLVLESPIFRTKKPAPPIVHIPLRTGIRETIAKVKEQAGENEPFYIVHLSHLIEQYNRWVNHLPGIRVFYAVKSNPDPGVLFTLASLGASFDCASQWEIEQILALTNDPSRVIFANPMKVPAQLKYAAAEGVVRVTADSVNEMEKIKHLHPHAEVLVRLKPDDSKSLSPLSSKFGSSFAEAQEMVVFGKVHGVKVVGCAFHVGSSCQSAQAYHDIILECGELFAFAKSVGAPMHVLDIGGGFPGMGTMSTGDSFEQMASVINATIASTFHDVADLEVFGEPGRYFAASSMTLVCEVVGKKPCLVHGKPGFKYYLNEGIYGAFNCIIFDHVSPKLQLLNPREHMPAYPCQVFGPTCDSIDSLGIMELPELFVGDVIFCESFGSYTACAASAFNGFTNSRRIYVKND